MRIKNDKRIKVAQKWENVDSNIKNPVRNTNQDYLKFINTSYFTEEAQKFLQWGYYTDAPPGTPDYEEYWDEQERRCFEGYEVGGVRVTGRHYFFMNFALMRARPIDPKTGKEKSRKIITFPRFLDHQYYHMHELEECFGEGPYAHDPEHEKKGMIWAKGRRKGSTYQIGGGIVAYNYNFLPASNNILAAYEKEQYRTTLEAVHYTVNHINVNTPWAKRRQVKSSWDNFRASYREIDENGIEAEKGFMSEVRALSYKDNPFKGIGQCFHPDQKILDKNLELVKIKDLNVGDKIMGPDGFLRTVKNKHQGYDLMTTFSQKKGVNFTANSKHLIYGIQNAKIKGCKQYEPFTIKCEDYLKMGDYFKRYFRTIKSEGLNNFNDKLEIDPYFYGLWLGDGDSHKMSIGTPDQEIIDYLYELASDKDFFVNKQNLKNNKADIYRLAPRRGRKNYYKIRHNGVYKEIDLQEFASLLDISYSHCRIIVNFKNPEWSRKKLKQYGIEYISKKRKDNSHYWQWFIDNNLNKNKHVLPKIKFLSKDEKLKFLAGLIDSDGSINSKKRIFTISQKDKKLLEDISIIAKSIGFNTSITKTKRKSGYGKIFHDMHKLTISGNIWEIPTKVKRKQAIKFKHHVKPLESSIKVENQYYGKYAGIEVDKDHLFMLEDFTIVHNSSDTFIFEEAGKFDNLLSAYSFAEPLWRDGSIMIGVPLIFGTGGEMSRGTVDFNMMFYNPERYGLKAYENIYDEGASGNCGFFIDNMWYYPGKIKKKFFVEGKEKEQEYDLVDKQGNSLRELAEEKLDQKRARAKEGDSTFYNNFISQEPKTPKEAFMRTSGSPLPVKELTEHEANLRINPKKWKGPEHIGYITFNAEKQIYEFKPDLQLSPVNNWPIKSDDNKEGAIVIWEHPQRKQDGTIPYGMYVAGIDPYSDDGSETSSLGCIILKNRFTGRIVAEYTGKPYSIKTFYENCRKLLHYYEGTALYESNKKGIVSYFEKYNDTHLLADTPPYLRDKGYIKYNSIGNDTKGVKIQTRELILHGIGLYKDWLNNPAVMQEESTERYLNLHTIKSHPILHESIYWNADDHFGKKKNYDRISAFIVLHIYEESLLAMHISDTEQEQETDDMPEFFKKQALFRQN